MALATGGYSNTAAAKLGGENLLDVARQIYARLAECHDILNDLTHPQSVEPNIETPPTEGVLSLSAHSLNMVNELLKRINEIHVSIGQL